MVEVVVGQVIGFGEGIGEIGRGWGISISDRTSYRNHYMCSGEATSLYSANWAILFEGKERPIPKRVKN